jgi:hypothetical protein
MNIRKKLRKLKVTGRYKDLLMGFIGGIVFSVTVILPLVFYILSYVTVYVPIIG